MKPSVRKQLHAAASWSTAISTSGADGLDLAAHLGQLSPALPVPAEKDETAHQWMLQSAAVIVLEPGSGDIEDDGACSGDMDGS